ncbi:MAG: hypothetical protein C0592_10120 [Marinilabiliales bacterium]|nr:MAG: hypothetical protein C0592_10120 [Marinilabiliales bacterium]
MLIYESQKFVRINILPYFCKQKIIRPDIRLSYMHRRFLSILLICILSVPLFSQPRSRNQINIAPSADSLNYYASIMFNGQNDIVRYEANENFRRILIETLYEEDAIHYNFDTVRVLSAQGPKDHYFKIYTWCIPLQSGKYDNFGIVLVKSKKTGTYKQYELRDVSTEVENPEKHILRKGVWYGAVYYQFIETKYQGQKVYTLIGWNGWDALTQQKIIEILTFTSRDEPVFGKIMFRGRKYFGKKRLIFEYGDQIVMKVRYENHDYRILSKKESKKRSRRGNQINNNEAMQAEKDRIKEKIKNEPMIVFDELVPMRPELEGQYQFYYPLSAEGNAFYFDNGRWNFRKLDLSKNFENNDKEINVGLKPKDD